MRVVYGARHRGSIPGVRKAYGQDWREQLCADEETAAIKIRRRLPVGGFHRKIASLDAFVVPSLQTLSRRVLRTFAPECPDDREVLKPRNGVHSGQRTDSASEGGG
jgi:hypothetical protein